jgi:hypothetical protein
MRSDDLYTIVATLKTYRHNGWQYKNVPVYLCRDGQVVPQSAEYILNYSPGCEAERYVSELFTADEAQRVQHYLSQFGEDCKIEKVNMPVPSDKCCRASWYPDQCNSVNSFTVSDLPELKVEAYANIELTQRVPEPDDFFIAYSSISQDNECFYCKRKVPQNAHYRVLVTLNSQTYGFLCDDCSSKHAPELHSSLNLTAAGEQDVKNLPKIGDLSEFRIQFMPDSDSLYCSRCYTSLVPVRPFAISSVSNSGGRGLLCLKCAKNCVPELLRIIKQFYASGAGEMFLQRYNKQKALITAGLFKKERLYGGYR